MLYSKVIEGCRIGGSADPSMGPLLPIYSYTRLLTKDAEKKADIKLYKITSNIKKTKAKDKENNLFCKSLSTFFLPSIVEAKKCSVTVP